MLLMWIWLDDGWSFIMERSLVREPRINSEALDLLEDKSEQAADNYYVPDHIEEGVS